MEQNTFLEECLELIYIQEGFEDIVNKVKAPARLKSIGTVLKTKDPKLVRKALHFIPTLKLSVVKKIASKRIDNFDKNYKMVNRKITAKMPSEAKEAASITLGSAFRPVMTSSTLSGLSLMISRMESTGNNLK